MHEWKYEGRYRNNLQMETFNFVVLRGYLLPQFITCTWNTCNKGGVGEKILVGEGILEGVWVNRRGDKERISW